MEYPKTIKDLRAFVQKVVRTSTVEKIPNIGGTAAPTDPFGEAVTSGDGTSTEYSFVHGQDYTPIAVVSPTSVGARGNFYVTTDAESVHLFYASAPPAGTNNLRWWYILKQPLL